MNKKRGKKYCISHIAFIEEKVKTTKSRSKDRIERVTNLKSPKNKNIPPNISAKDDRAIIGLRSGFGQKGGFIGSSKVRATLSIFTLNILSYP